MKKLEEFGERTSYVRTCAEGHLVDGGRPEGGALPRHQPLPLPVGLLRRATLALTLPAASAAEIAAQRQRHS